MKTSLVPFAALAFLFSSIGSTGCGLFSEPDPALPEASHPMAPVRPADPPAPLEGTPKTSEIDESFGVFVVADAAPGGDGTRARPFAKIADGITAAKENRKRVYVCDGVYREAIAIADGVSMVGGLDCSVATWSLGTKTSRIESQAIPALVATDITSTTRFSRFEVIAPDATEAGGSSIALFATNAAALTIDASRIVAGNAKAGADGVNPAPIVQGAEADGKSGPLSGPWCTAPSCLGFPIAVSGGEGGKSTCGSYEGGIGGTGGVWQAVYSPQALTNFWTVYGNDDGTYGAKGGALGWGGFATSGRDGASATTSNGFIPEGFIPANGTRGTNGSGGRAGSGGTGTKPTANAGQQAGTWHGVAGSGGGAAGCGGVAGTEGKGGGASVAAFVVDGAVTFVGSELVSKSGGAGGKGTFGSAPTSGGKGGPMIAGAPGTQGEDGTPGAVAGISGSGAGGPSVALVHFGAKPTVERTTFVVGQPGSGVATTTANGKTMPASAPGEAKEILAR